MATATAAKEVAQPKQALNRELSHANPWTTPTVVEICIGLEISGYLPAEF